ncbi:MAG: hypothetical protein RJA70_3176 [Pseudomonadota bacterium]|jgi:hypothetical protein
MFRALLLGLMLSFALGAFSGSVAAEEVRKVAIVVGANRAPLGRAALRFAHGDAQRVAEVLTTVGGFSSRDVVLLFDPSPGELLRALDQALSSAGQRSNDTLLFFYYSGHADERSLFPAGQALAFAALKSRLDDSRARLRIGLLDSCSGGSWTGTKGLKTVEPFSIDTGLKLAEEGSVLIASSSGHESAHETSSLRGSFFTHYWNAGLRGAADRGGDGIVSLNEAFEYARTLTIRETALIGEDPQHPSFQMKLSGRRDFPMATLANVPTTLVYDQATGPTELVRLSDGLVIIETEPGARRVRLGLPAGSYLVRRRTDEGVFALVVSLKAGGSRALAESELTRSTHSLAQTKGSEVFSPSQAASWSEQTYYASAAIGVRHAPVIDPGLRIGAADGGGVVSLRGGARLARHLWWGAPLALVFDAERQTGLNWFVWAGAPVLFGTGSRGDVSFGGVVGAGIDARFRFNDRRTFNASLSQLGPFELGSGGRNTFTTQLTLGASESLSGAVTFNLGAGLGANLVVKGELSAAPSDSNERGLVIALGSVQRAGLRPLPLIQVNVGEGWGIDAHAVAAYLPASRGWVETYMVGVSSIW